MNNLKIYTNNCKEEVINKLQFQKTHVEYTLGKSLSATSDVGKLRNNQEDSVIIAEHPENKKLKLIAVSDGVGGFSSGEIVSNHIIKKLTLWFENLALEDFQDMKELKLQIFVFLYSILDDLPFNPGAATLSCAIIGETETLIANVGDSRIYTYKEGKLKQETRDDSEVQIAYEQDIIPSKELMRFKKESNIITEAIDFNPCHYCPKTKIINNESYDRIYAFTDGVTDCISDKELETIIKNSKEETTIKIVDKALNTSSYLWKEIDRLPKEEKELCYDLEEIMNEDYWQDIEAGKDNTTAAEYRKK